MLFTKKYTYVLAFLMAFFLSACVSNIESANNNFMKEKLSSVSVTAPTEHLELLFFQQFNQITQNNGSNSNFELQYSLNISNTQALAFTGNSSNLKNTSLTIDFVLIDKQTEKIVHKGTITSQATSGAVSGIYAQEQSAKFAQERLALVLAERVYQDLYLYFLETIDS